MNVKQLENSGIQAVKLLRKRKHTMGLPFMINTKELPSTQCYLEYPDGRIKLATIAEDKSDFKILTEFTLLQSDRIRKKYKIS